MNIISFIIIYIYYSKALLKYSNLIITILKLFLLRLSKAYLNVYSTQQSKFIDFGLNYPKITLIDFEKITYKLEMKLRI